MTEFEMTTGQNVAYEKTPLRMYNASDDYPAYAVRLNCDQIIGYMHRSYVRPEYVFACIEFQEFSPWLLAELDRMCKELNSRYFGGS